MNYYRAQELITLAETENRSNLKKDLQLYLWNIGYDGSLRLYFFRYMETLLALCLLRSIYYHLQPPHHSILQSYWSAFAALIVIGIAKNNTYPFR